MKDTEESFAQFLKLLDIADRQRRAIDQLQAEAQGPTDSQFWEAELAEITAEFHSLILKGVTPEQFREFNEALAIKSKRKTAQRMKPT